MDNTGKTTLVRDLRDLLRVESITSPGPNFTKEEMYNNIENNLLKDDLVIIERFSPIEEIIYGKILRGYSKFSFKELYTINKKYHPVFIYCRPKKEDIFNFGERDQMEGVIEKSRKLLKGFDNLYIKMLQNDFDIIRYDFRTSTPKEMVLKYERIAK